MVAQQVCGTILVVSAAWTFALVAFVVKKDPLPNTIATEVRFFICWMMSLAFMFRYRSERGLKWFGPAQIRWGLVLRGFLTCSFVTLWWAALPMAPLGDCIAVIYCAPLLTVILSRVMLREKVPAVFPIQALLAIAGMCFIVQPPLLLKMVNLAPASTSDSGNYTLVVGAMIVSSLTPVVTRQTKEASWIEMEHVTSFLAVFVLNPIIFCVKHIATGAPVIPSTHVGAWEVCLVVLAALGSFAGVAMQTRGYQMADPGKAGMFNYLEIPFAYVLQLLDTHSAVSTNSIIGAALVLMACLLGAVVQLRNSRSALPEDLREDICSLETGESTGCEACDPQSISIQPIDTPMAGG